MEGNKIAQYIRGTGWVILIFGIIGSFIMGQIFPSISYSYSGRESESYNWIIAIIGICTSIISGLAFIGFAELIELSQQKLDTINRIKEMIEKDNVNEIVEDEKLPEL